jgi:(2Fe-2S) ferredoxin
MGEHSYGRAQPMDKKELARKAKSKGVGPTKSGTAAHHMLLCTGANCFPEVGAKTLRALGKQCKALREDGISVYVTEVKCLRLCRMGPIAVVYPEGIWYCGVTPENGALILSEHLAGGEVVEELAFLKDPLRTTKR